MTTGRRLRSASVALLLPLSACGFDAGSSDVGVVVDTVDGLPRVTSTGPGVWTEGEEWSVGDPVLVVGTVDGPPETIFGNLTGMALSPDGHLYLADEQTAEIRVFDRDGGAHLFTFGGKGEGPGEFRYVDGVALGPEGRVFVRDAQGMSVSVFESDGTYLDSFRLRRPYLQIGGGDGLWVDREGRVYDRTALDLGSEADSLGVMVYAADGEPLDTVLAAAWRSPKAYVTQDGARRASMIVPYHPSGQAAVGLEGSVATARGGSYEIRTLGSDGRSRRIVRRQLPPPPLGGIERDSAIARTQRRIDYLMEVSGGGELSDWSLPSHLPFISELHLDPEGNLWVGRDGFGGLAPRTFDVFGREGRFLGTVEIPLDDFRIRQIGPDFLLGVGTDELDVERAVVLPLSR